MRNGESEFAWKPGDFPHAAEAMRVLAAGRVPNAAWLPSSDRVAVSLGGVVLQHHTATSSSFSVDDKLVIGLILPSGLTVMIAAPSADYEASVFSVPDTGLNVVILNGMVRSLASQLLVFDAARVSLFDPDANFGFSFGSDLDGGIKPAVQVGNAEVLYEAVDLQALLDG